MAKEKRAKGAESAKEPKGKIERVAKLVMPQRAYIRLRISGPMIVVNNLRAKHNRDMMIARALGKKTSKKETKEKRDFVMEYEQARYLDENGHDGVPTNGIRKCIATAVKWTPEANITQADMLRAISVNELRPITRLHFDHSDYAAPVLIDDDDQCSPVNGKGVQGRPIMREDIVRLQGQSRAPDIRYRPEYRNWYCDITVGFPTTILSAQQVATAVAVGGEYVGLCEWRPDKGGDWGKFTVSSIPEEEEEDETQAA